MTGGWRVLWEKQMTTQQDTAGWRGAIEDAVGVLNEVLARAESARDELEGLGEQIEEAVDALIGDLDTAIAERDALEGERDALQVQVDARE